jgi:hypothetical protein
MPKQRPFDHTFECPKANRWVAIKGYDVELSDDEGFVAIATGPRSCSGAPACGTMLGADNGPYKTNLNTGR